jgi:protein gp37
VPKALEEIAKIRRAAIKTGTRPRVFINSMSDFFEDRRDLDDARLQALDAMRLAPEVDFLLLTKRPECILELLRRARMNIPINSPLWLWLRDWVGIQAGVPLGDPPRNIWVGTTAETQAWAELRIVELVKVPAAVRFLSVEPMLGPLDLEYPRSFFPNGPSYCCSGRECGCMGKPTEAPLWYGINWIICGGESGAHARPMHPDWARDLRDQCAAAGVPFFMKQLSQANAGKGLKDFESFPEDLKVREFPNAQG